MSTSQADSKTKRVDTTNQLDTLLLDAQLVTAIKRGSAKGDIKAIQMGYQRLGLMRGGEFLGEVTPEPALDASRRPFHRES